MKMIEQNKGDLLIDTMESLAWIDQNGYSVCITKDGARQLIEILQEWVGDENNQ